MAIRESDRHDLYRSLERAIGKKPTETFMNMVGNAPSTEVATRGDLERLEGRISAEIHRVARQQLVAVLTVVGILNAVVFAALKLP